MNRKTIVILVTGLTWTVCMYGQQTPIYTQYMFNPFIYNPAVAGVDPYYQIRSNHRFQWIGIKDPPVTNTLSFQGPHSSMPMGFGGYLYNDVTGPTSKTGLTGSYAYNIGLTESMRLSMGISLGIIQFRVDGTQIQFKEAEPTLAIVDGVQSSYVPDANFGAYLYSENYFAGFSTSQLINTKLKLTNDENGLNKLRSHFYFIGGYKYEINTNFKIEPSLMVKGTAPAQLQADVTARVIYQERGWLGVSYRSQDAVSCLLGYIHEERIYIGYSYDFTVTSLKKYNSGSHEIMIGYRFNDLK
jgi:type IX secretion system PorP/SprF family membrane protein